MYKVIFIIIIISLLVTTVTTSRYIIVESGVEAFIDSFRKFLLIVHCYILWMYEKECVFMVGRSISP